MDPKRFYKDHPYISHYVLSIPLLILLVVGLNIITQTPVDRIEQVIVASFFFPIPIIIGLFVANLIQKSVEKKFQEPVFLASWLIVTNALPLLNLITGQQSPSVVGMAMLPITTVLLMNYSLRRSLI